MASPEYRRRLQRLASLLVSVLPSTWDEVTLRVDFPSRAGGDLDLFYREPGSTRTLGPDLPSGWDREAVEAARDLQAEIEAAGNPPPTGFTLVLNRDGSSTVDVDY